MRNLADKGGGSSRFISGREEMEKTFGSELDRMIVPEARDVDIEIELLQGAQVQDTWGYDHVISGNTVRYHLSTLHHRDYETILASIWIPQQSSAGARELARISLAYLDTAGQRHIMGPYSMRVSFVDMESPVSGFSDGMVLHSGTMLHFAQALKDIGELYYTRELQRAMDRTVEIKKELVNANLRLGREQFSGEIEILDKYIRILGEDLQLTEGKTRRILADDEILPQVRERSLQENLQNLFREITLDMGERKRGTIAISGFTKKDGSTSDLLTLVNEMALVEVKKHGTLQVVEREKLDMVLDEQKLALSDLIDTANAIKVGQMLTVSHMLTGTILEMPQTVVIFGRIINVETAEIESAAQVIIPRSREVEALL